MNSNPEYNQMGHVIGMITSFNILPHNSNYNDIKDVKENKKEKFLICQNPVSDILKIKNINCKNVELSVYDMQGKLVSKGNYNGNVISINFTSFKKDLYIIKINDDNKINNYKINKI